MCLYSPEPVHWSKLSCLILFSLAVYLFADTFFVRASFQNLGAEIEIQPSVHPIASNVRDLNSEHKFPGKFNLIEDASFFTGALKRPTRECSLELINTERLQQDHPCVVNKIKKQFLYPPSDKSLNLDYPEVDDPSDGQAEAVRYLLKNKTNGFFIECGALDGENLSNTLYMERFLNWTGLLIEADQEVFKTLLTKNRKAWATSACLSDDPYPQEVTFRAAYALGGVVNERVPEKNFSGVTGGRGRVTRTQCFPLYSILLAVNRTIIDYFSLDIEGHDIYVLKTIPFDRVHITVLSVEISRNDDREFALYEEIVDYMKRQGYELLHPKKMGSDAIFIKSNFVKTAILNHDDKYI